jgi:hypothetical protein
MDLEPYKRIWQQMELVIKDDIRTGCPDDVIIKNQGLDPGFFLLKRLDTLND